ncbi:hypothetical protein FDUTEX481_10155 [Tolypothrix sp. PCC 7601]|nr:hypothetical protein FDUTEX481_10155 [Tolypothrix sp. PCC 7601]
MQHISNILEGKAVPIGVKTIQNSKLSIQNYNQWGLETRH